MAGADPVAGIADAGQHVAAAVDGAEERQPGSGAVDRPRPARFDRNVVQRGVGVAEPALDSVGDARGAVEGRADPPAERHQAVHPALAEDDAAIGRRPVVMDHHAAVRDGHAVVPADGREAFRGRRGGDDVARHHDDRPADLGEADAPGVEREDHLVRPDRAARRHHARPAVAPEASERRVLVEADPALARDAPEAAGETGRLHARRGRLEDAGTMHGRARPRRDLRVVPALERGDLIFADGVERALPGAALTFAGGGPQPAVAAILRVDPVVGAEAPDGAHRVGRRLGEAHRFLAAADLLQGLELRPPAQHEAAVAPARAGAADVLLDQHHVRGGLQLLEPQRGPEAGEAAADDADIGCRVAFQRRRRGAVVECLAEPVAPPPDRERAHSASAMARPTDSVEPAPPRSGVSGPPSASTVWMAFSMARAASPWPR